MSEQDWTEHLGKSSLPADEFTYTTGNNFGLDSFQFDIPDNLGVLDSGRLPSVNGLSGLPDGLVRAATPDMEIDEIDENGPDLTEMLSPEEGGLPKDASLVNLQWLDPTQEQDPARLPSNENALNTLPILEEAWGVGRETTGVRLVPNEDREIAEYRESLKAVPKSKLPGVKTAAQLQDAVCRAVRLAHLGYSLLQIKQALVDDLGHEAARVAPAVDLISQELGLLGKVFVRAAAFPGLRNGRWVKDLRKVARTAKYVVTDDPSIGPKLGMKAVASDTDIPWKQARFNYAQWMEAAGYQFTLPDPRESLRQAFLRGPVTEDPQPVAKPVQKVQVASKQEAQAALAAPRRQAPPVQNGETQALTAKRAKVLTKVAKLVHDGHLSVEDGLRLQASSQPPETILKLAMAKVGEVREGTPYTGEGTKVREASPVVTNESLTDKQAALETVMHRKVQGELQHAIKTGLLSQEEVGRILGMGKSASETRRIMALAIQMAGTQRQAAPAAVKTREFQGALVGQVALNKSTVAVELTPEQQRIRQASAQSGIKAQEFVGLLRWAKQHMSEGYAGKTLDDLLRARFSMPLRQAAKQLLREARNTHEGLAGFAYVDAQAYASPAGVTGCEKGALRHRSNGLKYVLAMDRCATCTQNSAGKCQQYNKKLAAQAPVKDPETYRQANIHMANAPDAEQTAAMFDQGEYGLHNAAIDQVSFEEAPQTESLSKVLFGGLEL